MNTFVWKGEDAHGNFRSERVLAENAQVARMVLLEQGWSNLQLVTDEICDNAIQTLQGPEDVESYRERVSSDEEVQFFEGQGPGFWSQYGKALLKAKGSLILLVLLSIWGALGDRTWLLVVGNIGLGLVLVIFPVLYAFFSLPMQDHLRLNKAKVWSRWQEVLLCIERLQQTHRFTRIGVGDVELARCKAQAFAATGRLEDGLHEFSRFANDPALPNWNYMSFLAGIYDSAKEYEKALECRQKAAAEKPDSSVVWIDLAYGLVRGLNRPSEAREALARAEILEITALGVPYLSFLRGLICWREARLAEARQHFEKALPGFEPYKHNPLVEGLVLLAKSYLCAVHRALGEFEVASSYLRQTQRFLEAAGEGELLEACGGPLTRPTM